VGDAAALHDTVVLNTLAVVLGKAALPLPSEPPMCHWPPSVSMQSFHMVADWLWLTMAL
jgi:hypothetical protein